MRDSIVKRDSRYCYNCLFTCILNNLCERLLHMDIELHDKIMTIGKIANLPTNCKFFSRETPRPLHLLFKYICFKYISVSIYIYILKCLRVCVCVCAHACTWTSRACTHTQTRRRVDVQVGTWAGGHACAQACVCGVWCVVCVCASACTRACVCVFIV